MPTRVRRCARNVARAREYLATTAKSTWHEPPAGPSTSATRCPNANTSRERLTATPTPPGQGTKPIRSRLGAAPGPVPLPRPGAPAAALGPGCCPSLATAAARQLGDARRDTEPGPCSRSRLHRPTPAPTTITETTSRHSPPRHRTPHPGIGCAPISPTQRLGRHDDPLPIIKNTATRLPADQSPRTGTPKTVVAVAFRYRVSAPAQTRRFPPDPPSDRSHTHRHPAPDNSPMRTLPSVQSSWLRVAGTFARG